MKCVLRASSSCATRRQLQGRDPLGQTRPPTWRNVKPSEAEAGVPGCSRQLSSFSGYFPVAVWIVLGALFWDLRLLLGS